MQRLMHDNDVKLTGSFSAQTLLNVIKSARESGMKGDKYFQAHAQVA